MEILNKVNHNLNPTTLIAFSDNHDYQQSNKALKFSSRINLLCKTIFQTLLHLIFDCFDKNQLRSQWKKIVWDQKKSVISKNVIIRPRSDVSLPSTNLIPPLSSSSLMKTNAYLTTLDSELAQFCKIFEIYNTRIISLAEKNLHILPSSFGNLNQLNHLDLTNNQLQTLPNSFENLTNLRSLNLCNNQFSEIPDCLFRLPSACDINLKENPLSQEILDQLNQRVNQTNYQGPKFQVSSPTPSFCSELMDQIIPRSEPILLDDALAQFCRFFEIHDTSMISLTEKNIQLLPSSFGNLINLFFLNLINNQLQTLPDSFGNLTNLQFLYLYNNKLELLPTSFGNLNQLNKLNLANNQLQILPQFFGNLTNLTKLYLNNNKLELLPTSFGKLTQLKKLQIAYNQLQSLPELFTNLINLQTLDLNNNNLRTLPDSFGNLNRLHVLNLSNNQLQVLPHSFGNLTQLRDLHIAYNQLQSLPGSLTNLVNLQTLDLNNNNLQTLPNSFGNLNQINYLNLANNQFHSLPESFGNLTKLQCLYLYNNQIQILPETFSNLINLTELHLNYNQLQTLPETFTNLTNLRNLNLTGNNFETIPECLFHLSSECEIYLEANPLSREILDQLNRRTSQSNYQGPRFHVSIYTPSFHNNQTNQIFLNFESILKEWCNKNCQTKLLSNLPQTAKNNLLNWFSRVKSTPFYTSNPQAAKEKISSFLDWMANENNLDYLQVAYQILADATSTCGDRMATSVNELMLHMRLCQSQNLSPEELKTLIIGSARLNKLFKIAQKTSASQRMTDPIEVHLCYQIHLKEALELPIETNSMLYERMACLSEQNIQIAKERILRKTSTFEQQTNILMASSFWMNAVKSQLSTSHIEKLRAFYNLNLNSNDSQFITIDSLLNKIEFESRQSIYEQLAELCEQVKANKMNEIDIEDGEAVSAYFSQFHINEKTIWNPAYIATLAFLS
ncbi:unnamed protein product [Candidatus Protochlamydia amoebophila UWE25]|uniref:NEL domain-containing protein n=1 Tax=Protochlamydia amoebophila (strain UWE25) TaxID=264201 RepID=A0A2P9H989_PARUW|nr:unnamed protein product [Candidatus Protochlamydia amoebophila UWE25]